VEEVIEKGKTSQTSAGGVLRMGPQKMSVPINLSAITSQSTQRISTKIGELDRVLGGGIVPGMVVLVSGEPGIGKSTLLLQTANSLAADLNLNTLVSKSKLVGKAKVLYVAGEESAGQIKIRSDRLGIKSAEIEILEETDVDRIINEINSNKSVSSIKLIIVDSVQTLSTEDLTGTAGSVGQVRECSGRLSQVSKKLGIPLLLVGHVTKEGAIAGPKVLEHLVDTVIYIEGERYENLRLVRATKNRFGPTDEVGIFQMTDLGMIEVLDPNGFLQTEKTAGSPGSCLTIALEGTRPLLVEIQALVTSTPIPNPRRVASGVDHNRLLTIVAILQKRMNIPLYKEDVYVSVSGGLKVMEPAMDLPIALAILSSYREKSMPTMTLAVGELDLLGNVRRVNNLEKRLKEAKKLGFKTILSSVTLSSLNNFKF